VHSDGRAAESARAIDALAYTAGSDVVFGTGNYKPATSVGQRLIAHELAHVVQQSHAMVLTPGMSVSSDASEQEADQIADSAIAKHGPSESAIRPSMPTIQRSADSSGSSGSSGGAAGGGAIPKPTPKEDGTCQCQLDLCWRPIQAYWGVVGALGYKHGFINVIDSKCQTHNLYVDPSMHKAGDESHSHAADSTPGWDTSGEACVTLNTAASGITCTNIDKLATATAKYETMDVAYDAKDGPNSNSFLEWILSDVAIAVSGVPSGLLGWDYYIKHSSQRSSPPAVKRLTAAPPAPSPTVVPAAP
jgi:hypothetical protein